MNETDKTHEMKIVDKRLKENETVPTTDLVMAAIQKGFQPEFIEKMMAVQERHEANEARKAYHVSMAKFKANPPKIWRDMQVKYGSGESATSWSHADLGVSAEAINKSLGEHGLNATWRTLPLENDLTRITCIITHELGHSEETYLEAGPDKSGSKNAIQAIGSTIFYLERYTLFALAGLAPARMDDNGQAGGVEYITLDMQTEIHDLIKSTKADKAKVLKYLGAESVETIPLKEYGNALVAFKAKKDAAKKSTRDPGEEG